MLAPFVEPLRLLAGGEFKEREQHYRMAQHGIIPCYSSRQGKVDSANGKKGAIVSLDVDEYVKVANHFGFPRIQGDDGPGELVQSFDDGKMAAFFVNENTLSLCVVHEEWSERQWAGCRAENLTNESFSRRRRSCAHTSVLGAGLTWNVRWLNTGNVGNYYTGAYQFYHVRIGANGTDKSPLDLVRKRFQPVRTLPMSSPPPYSASEFAAAWGAGCSL